MLAAAQKKIAREKSARRRAETLREEETFLSKCVFSDIIFSIENVGVTLELDSTTPVIHDLYMIQDMDPHLTVRLDMYGKSAMDESLVGPKGKEPAILAPLFAGTHSTQIMAEVVDGGDEDGEGEEEEEGKEVDKGDTEGCDLDSMTFKRLATTFVQAKAKSRLVVHVWTPYYTTLYHTISHYTILYHTIPHYITLYHTIPHYTHYTTLYHTTPQLYTHYTTLYDTLP